METKNYKFELMHQGQEHKDVMYNESILKLDANLNMSVLNFTDSVPASISYGDRFILSSGTHKNKICYYAHPDKGTEYLDPYNNMLVFLVKDDCFAKFSSKENTWQKISIGTEVKPASEVVSFTGISGDFTLPALEDNHYLYLNNKAHIKLDRVSKAEITVIIKQNETIVFDVKWQTNILWPEKKPVSITAKVNAIDMFRFYKLPESNHFLGEIIGQDYQY